MNPVVVPPAWLEEHLDDPAVKVLEISNTREKTCYWEGHVPGAAWVYWKDLCWHDTDRQFVSPETLAARFGRMGIRPDDTVVLYGLPVQYGTYAFWALTMAGHRDLRVLDGARARWVKEGRRLSRDVPRRAPVAYPVPQGDASMRVGRDDVRAHLGSPGRLLLDVRSPEEYAGDRVMEHPTFDHGAERNGRIPGAVHMFFRELLQADDSFRSPAELRAALERVGATPEKAREVVVYCRLSHRASLVWVAMKHLLGFDHVKIYDGSWTEWGSIVGFPIER